MRDHFRLFVGPMWFWWEILNNFYRLWKNGRYACFTNQSLKHLWLFGLRWERGGVEGSRVKFAKNSLILNKLYLPPLPLSQSKCIIRDCFEQLWTLNFGFCWTKFKFTWSNNRLDWTQHIRERFYKDLGKWKLIFPYVRVIHLP